MRKSVQSELSCCLRADGRDEANNRCSQLCERALKTPLKKKSLVGPCVSPFLMTLRINSDYFLG